MMKKFIMLTPGEETASGARPNWNANKDLSCRSDTHSTSKKIRLRISGEISRMERLAERSCNFDVLAIKRAFETA
jgi:hypothetical protein